MKCGVATSVGTPFCAIRPESGRCACTSAHSTAKQNIEAALCCEMCDKAGERALCLHKRTFDGQTEHRSSTMLRDV